MVRGTQVMSKCQTVQSGDSWSSQGLQTLRAAALEQPTCHFSCNRGVIVSHESQWSAWPWDTAGTGCSQLWGQLIFRHHLFEICTQWPCCASWPASTSTGIRGYQIKHESLIALGFLHQQRLSVHAKPSPATEPPAERVHFCSS